MMAGDVDIPSQGQQLMELHRENERLRAALREIWNHPDDMACDGECAARMNALAGRALGVSSDAAKPGTTPAEGTR